MKTLSSLLIDTEVIKIINNNSKNIESICFDSRESQVNSLFIAINGYEVDGHKYIDQAIKKGAIAIVCSVLPNNIDNKVSYVLVKDSRKALAEIANIFYDEPSKGVKLFGVTGTNGKTTFTFLVNSILNNLGIKNGIIGTTGIFLGKEKIESNQTTPDPLTLNKIINYFKERGVESICMEVSSHALSQFRAHKLDFDATAFTNISHDHLDYHSSFEDYLEAKSLLFQNQKCDSYAIINSDDDNAKYILTKSKGKNITVGINDNPDFQIKSTSTSLGRIEFVLFDKLSNSSFKVESNLTAFFNIYNLSQAIVLVHKFYGIPMERVVVASKNVRTAPGRMESLSLRNEALAIVDYAHTPDSLQKALQSCRELLKYNSNSRLIVVFGCGGDRDKSKRPIMGEISAKYADKVIITDDNPRTESSEKIIIEILDGIEKKDKALCINNRQLAIKKAYEMSNKGDIILIAGKGHETYQIIGKDKYHFDDMEEIKNIGFKKD